MVIGSAILVTLIILEKYVKGPKGEKEKEVAKTVIEIEVDNIVHELSNGRDVTANYDLLHRTKGGLRMLIGTVFTFLSTPEEKHAAATYIFNQEVRIHRSKVKATKCLRAKGWSEKGTADLLENIQQPNCLKRAKYQVTHRIQSDCAGIY